ncbi:hypothetical protein [Larsenimonas salina]|uniref:hypothetical protein n=1 Tax=Larsenimonas salina TaxID=1295565 RepID=UPI0020730A68|nr:hypothetical protein [Larsenimonas salina]MCM5705394.1 hypothetical protein [Larsenimonas salina]
MKRILLTSALIAALMPVLSSSASADEHGRETLYKSWSLSAQQSQQVEQANQTFKNKLDGIDHEAFDSRKARHEAMNEAAKAHHEALKTILDADQIRALTAYERQFDPREETEAFKHALFDSWQLDQGARNRLDAARKAIDISFKADTNADKESRHAARQKAMDDYRQTLSDVLTPAQRQVLRSLKHFKPMPTHRSLPPKAGVEALIKSWHLSLEKRQALEEINQHFKTQLEQHRPPMPPREAHGAPSSAPDHEQKHKGPRSEKRSNTPDLDTLFKAHDRALANVLSREQIAALNLFMPKQPKGPMGKNTNAKGAPKDIPKPPMDDAATEH